MKIKVLAPVLSLLCTPALAQEAALKLVCFDYPPYMERDGQGAKGMMVEVLREAFSRMKKPIEIAFYPPLRGYQMLLTGQADGMFTVKKTAEREQAAIFPKEALLTQEFVFVVPKDSKIAFRGALSEMANISLGVVNQGSYGEVFDSAANAGLFRKLDKSPDFMTNFRKLTARRMQAIVSSRSTAIAILKSLHAEQDFKVSGPPIETAYSYLAFANKPGYSDLAHQFGTTLTLMHKDGSYGRIEKKYLLP